jgi:hypothetical protein
MRFRWTRHAEPLRRIPGCFELGLAQPRRLRYGSPHPQGRSRCPSDKFMSGVAKSSICVDASPFGTEARARQPPTAEDNTATGPGRLKVPEELRSPMGIRRQGRARHFRQKRANETAAATIAPAVMLPLRCQRRGQSSQRFCTNQGIHRRIRHLESTCAAAEISTQPL